MHHFLLNVDGSNQRLKFFCRLLLAIFAGHLISTGGEFQSFSELRILTGYPIALLTSVLIAIVAVEQVHYSTLLLNRKYPVYDSNHLRLVWQIITCFALPFLNIFLLATLYYAYHEHFILDTMWLTDHGWQIFIMLVALNLCFRVSQNNVLIPPVSVVPGALVFLADAEIAYAVHVDGVNKVVSDIGAQQLDTRSLPEIYKALEPGKYILNPKASIIRRDNIKYKVRNKDGTYIIVLIAPTGTSIVVSNNQSKFYVDYKTKDCLDEGDS